jgi:hypothetical protein
VSKRKEMKISREKGRKGGGGGPPGDGVLKYSDIPPNNHTRNKKGFVDGNTRDGRRMSRRKDSSVQNANGKAFLGSGGRR